MQVTSIRGSMNGEWYLACPETVSAPPPWLLLQPISRRVAGVKSVFQRCCSVLGFNQISPSSSRHQDVLGRLPGLPSPVSDHISDVGDILVGPSHVHHCWTHETVEVSSLKSADL